MTQGTGGYPQSTGAALPPDQPSAADVARHEAAGIGQSAGEAGGQVAHAATQRARKVASETAQQARSVLDEGVGQLRRQAREAQQKVASGLRTLADELRGMAKKGGQSGSPATSSGRRRTGLTARPPGLNDESRAISSTRCAASPGSGREHSCWALASLVWWRAG